MKLTKKEIDFNLDTVQAEQKLRRKEQLVREFKVDTSLRKIMSSSEAEKSLKINSLETDWEAAKILAEKDDQDRQHALYMVNEDVNNFMCIAPRSLCVIAAASGTGKSTFTANIAYPLMQQGKKVLIIVNEETQQDAGVRIACLALNVSIHKYKDKDLNSLPADIRRQVQDYLPELAGKVDVIGLNHNDNSDIVTTYEGMEQILFAARNKYDVIIIDYYQNVSRSVKNPDLNQYQVQEMFSSLLDREKHTVGCPIILFAQIKRSEADTKERIEGRKVIYNRCTDFFEMVIDKENSVSAFKCHKDRWLGQSGEFVTIGYDHGRFVKCDDEFKEKVRRRALNRKADELEQLIDKKNINQASVPLRNE